MQKEKNELEKPPVIPVPANVNPKYSKMIFDLYHMLEMVVPKSIWNETLK